MNKKISMVWRSCLAAILILPIMIVAARTPQVRADAPSPWFKSPTAPVLSTGAAWDNGGVGTVSVILDGITYKMWYTGYDATNGLLQIGYATSSDGRSWQRGNNGNAVLTPSGVFETEGIGAPRVIKEVIGGVTTYRMWYTGYNTAAGVFTPRIFYATSGNGIAWDRQNGGLPVLPLGGAGAFDEKGVHSAAVIKDGETYKMWYTGRSGDTFLGVSKIGYATSPNGVAWDKVNQTGGPVLSATNDTFDTDGVAVPSVVKTENKYYMWYSGYSGFHMGEVQVKIGAAESDDGITNWTKTANAVLDKASSGWSAGGVGAPWVIYNGANAALEMWYSGVDANLNSKVGYAATANTSLTVTVTLQGADRPTAGYSVPLTLKLYTVAVTTANIGPATPASEKTMSTAGGEITNIVPNETNRTITFTVGAVPAGLYNVTLYSPHTLVSYKANVSIPAGGSALNMGTLQEGDATDIMLNSKGIDITDFTNFALAYEAVSTSPNWNEKADFDRNGQVAILDFSLLYTNYGKSSPQTVQ